MVACAVSSIAHYLDRGAPLLAVWDVYGYYAYLPAAVTFNALDQFAFADKHFAEYPMKSGLYQLMETGVGRRIPVYTNGMALVWAPFYLVAEGIASVTACQRDGMSAPYQWSILLASLCIGLMALLLLRRLLLRYVQDRVVACTLLILLFGTNYLHYLAFDPGMPHSYLLAMHVLMLYCLDSWFRSPQWRYATGLGAAFAIACLIRPTEVIWLVVPAGYALSLAHNFTWRRHYLWHAAVALMTVTLFVLPQIALWLANSGHLFFNAYAEAGHTFYFDGRYLLDGLFSYRKGWLVYTPVMLLSLIGLTQMRAALKPWRWTILALVIIHIYITFSWHWWFYANSFGARPMIHIYPELGLALAALITACWWRRWLRMGVLVLSGLFIALNLLQTWQYNNGVLPGDGVNKAFYWYAFGRTEIDRSELKYLRLPERLSHRDRYRRTEIGSIQFAVEEALPDPQQFAMRDGRGGQLLTPEVRYSAPLSITLGHQDAAALHGQWVESAAKLWISGQDFNSSQNAQLILEGNRDGERLFWQNMNFQVFAEPRTWTDVDWEHRLPDNLQPGDELRAYIWNRSTDTILLHALRLSLLTR